MILALEGGATADRSRSSSSRFGQDALDNQAFLARGKLTIPVPAVGGEKSYGPKMAADMRFVAANVKEAVITNAGHRVMEEQPAQTISLIRGFLDSSD